MTLFDKAYSRRVAYTFALLATLAATFWTIARYPDLDDKALMGGAIALEDPLSFEALIPVTQDHSIVERIAFTTLNWLDTNRNGMIFGVSLGAVFLTLLGYVNRRSLNGLFSNTLLGVSVGMPLGVCVNCAAPIAKGLYAGGARAETTLAAMIASPTLNIVVLTMLFGLFPFYMALTKLVLSIVFILLVIPLIVRLLPSSQHVAAETVGPACSAENLEQLGINEKAFVNFCRDYAANLWFIVRTTVPLMLLAGVLGAVLATLVPVELLTDRPFLLVSAVVVALLGVFAPVPIGFDVVLSGALLNGGVDQGYVMILLFSLGIFSIYSFVIVLRTISARAAMLVTVAVVVLSLGAGGAVHAYHDWQLGNALELLVVANGDDPDGLVPDRGSNGSAHEAAAQHSVDTSFTVELDRIPFRQRSPEGASAFSRVEAWRIGIDKPIEFSMVDMWPPFWEGRSISSGDIDLDGDLDLVLASTQQGLYVYANDATGQFHPQELELGLFRKMPIFNAALVDIDNDGWLDLFVTTYGSGNYWIPNDSGRFDVSQAVRVRNRDDAVLTLAVSFADVDKNGLIDVALGNWAAGWYRRVPGEESRNRVVFNDGALSGERFTELAGIPGETLSILLTDFNADGRTDLLVGNDFEIPDYFYIGGERGFTPITHADQIVPHTTTTTMSLKTADLWNDGRISIYAGQIAGRSSNVSERLNMRPIANYCDGIERESDLATCRQNMSIKRWYRAGNSFDPIYASRCQEMSGRYAAECRGMLIKDLAIQRDDPKVCRLIPKVQVIPRHFCDVHFRPTRTPSDREAEESIQQILARNVLLVPLQSGQFKDLAVEAGLEVGGWSWDTKIGDFDNDGWLDVYIVNGTWVPNVVTPSNLFFKNRADGTFEEKTESYGLEDYLITAAATQFDMDGDGDLDIVAATVNGPTIAFINNSAHGNSIEFEVRDLLGNRFGIGTRLEIHFGEEGELRQSREIQLGGGFMSFDALVAHFGLGERESIKRLSIRWSDGQETVLDQTLAAGALYRISRRPNH